MMQCIARIFEPLLWLLWPASGRHRSLVACPAEPPKGAPTVRLPLAPALRSKDVGPAHPYVVAQERCQEVQRQRMRRRALWFAVHGVDLGPCLIHGVEVAA